ncbi:uncharacterized protein LOC115333106 [Ixodes scapularis]|uniref:uncharacterized protein LOC115333106 n=1 Tax=Ixodes scapularis TaxID=6945 RepID=UPI001A9F0CD6|nr:uncharacterized protein LOC115333106 [Ixodes scapularis]
MPLHCAAQDCMNCSSYNGRLVHTFPTEPTLRKLWIRAARPSQPTWLPSKSDWLCSDHFADEDYHMSPTLLRSLGLPTKRCRLKPGVVPSLFTRKRKQQQPDGNEEKRRRKEIIDDLLGKLPQATATDTVEQVDMPSTSSTTNKTRQSLDPQHEPPHDESAGIEEPCFSSASSLSKAARARPDLLDAAAQARPDLLDAAAQARPDLLNAATQSSDLYLLRNASTQVIIKNPSRYSQTDPVLVRPRCSSPNHLLQAQLDWTLPTVLTQLPQPPMPPEPSAPLQPEVPPQPHTVTSEPAIPEDSGEESFTELPEQHLEADTTYLPSDTSLLMMSGTSFLRDHQTSTSCASPLDKDNSAAINDHQTSTSCANPLDQENSAAINDHILERKFLIFESSLDELLAKCPKCAAPCHTIDKKVKGTCLTVRRICNNGDVHCWSSQPIVNRRPLGNILFAAVTLYSGCIVKKVLRLFTQIGVPCISYRTFFKVQAAFLLPAIRQVWNKQQTELFKESTGRGLVLACDGRSDSPGHSAKYGTYTAIDSKTKKVLHVETVQSNETKGSWAMELEGLKRTLVIFEANGLIVDSVITDRHSMIKCFLAKVHPHILHRFDCWHVAKGIKKRLVAAGKLKSLAALQDWVQPIVKHLYWCAESSEEAPDEILPKWASLVGHVADIHDHADPTYPKCQHGDLGKKKWLPEGLPAHDKLKSIVLSKALLKDIPHLSTSAQTFSTECFHSTLIQFAPKSTHFGYQSMTARTYVAALHFNENGSRPQATTKEGSKRWLLKCPKQTKRAVVAPTKGPCTYVYVRELLEEALSLNSHYASYRVAREAHTTETPPPLSSGYERPDKETLILSHQTRFNC